MADKSFNYSINGLRGLCIFMVFIFHVENSGLLHGDGGVFRGFLSTFKYGVEIFFMISGYVIVSSIRRKNDLKEFYKDRMLRIYPVWIPMHLATFVLAPLVGKSPVHADQPLYIWVIYFFSAMFLLPPVVPVPLFHPAAWSLSYEWFFYIAAGLVAVLATIMRKNIWLSCVGYALAAILVAVFLNIFPRAVFFIPGVIVTLYEDKIRKWASFFSFPAIFLVAFLVAWSFTGADPAEPATTMREWAGDARILAALLALIFGFIAFAGIALGRGTLAGLLSKPIMQFYGKISYSFYLASTLAFFPVKVFTTSFLLGNVSYPLALSFFVVLSFLLSTLMAWASWYVIEYRFSYYLKKKIHG